MEQFERLQRELHHRLPELEVRTGEPMSRHTTFRIGGPAALMALPRTKEEAAGAITIAAELGIEPFFLGNGSNLLVSDKGVHRFIIKTVPGLQDCRIEGTTLVAGSGVLLSRLSVLARDNGLSGLEFAHGIPGSLGGAVRMNAGAYGGEMAQVVTSVACLTGQGEAETVTQCGFSYRHSIFCDGTRMILGATVALRPGTREEISAHMEQFMLQRQEKQPIDLPSAGSMFKRPPGAFAAALIDQCGLKGLQVGNAQVSPRHAGFVVNLGGATCADVLALTDLVRARVLQETGIPLEREVMLLT